MEFARFGDTVATGVTAVVHDLDEARDGFWAVVVTFEGAVTAVRFAERSRVVPSLPPWNPLTGPWDTSLERTAYLVGVTDVRRRIADGTVYQVNLCRVLSHPWPDDGHLPSLAPLLDRGNPSPHAATIHVPSAGLDVLCASPEAHLLRDGERITSRPIKGTATTSAAMLPKDYAENVMIADLVRNDLQHVCRPGTVSVDGLCRLEEHPGLVHLVTDVTGTLRPGTPWSEVMAATFPPGSVSGAPKSSALSTIHDLETLPRGPYCGAVGWWDADARRAELAVGIRTFWVDDDGTGTRRLAFGTGAGITWGSDPAAEWDETELKAARLVGLASGRVEA